MKRRLFKEGLGAVADVHFVCLAEKNTMQTWKNKKYNRSQQIRCHHLAKNILYILCLFD